MKQSTQLDRLRDILNCTCSYNEEYDGKSWNNKTQEYDDCSCVERIPQLQALISQTLSSIEKEIDELGTHHPIVKYEVIENKVLNKAKLIIRKYRGDK